MTIEVGVPLENYNTYTIKYLLVIIFELDLLKLKLHGNIELIIEFCIYKHQLTLKFKLLIAILENLKYFYVKYRWYQVFAADIILTLFLIYLCAYSKSTAKMVELFQIFLNYREEKTVNHIRLYKIANRARLGDIPRQIYQVKETDNCCV